MSNLYGQGSGMSGWRIGFLHEGSLVRAQSEEKKNLNKWLVLFN